MAKLGVRVEEVEKQLSSLTNTINNAIKETFEGAEFKVIITKIINEAVKKAVSEVEAKFNQQLKVKTEEIKKLKSEVETLADKLNDIEQYGRRDSVRVFNVPDNADKSLGETVSCDVINKLPRDARFDIEEDTVRYHRVGRANPGKPCPVIIKFISYKKKMIFLKSRRVFKGCKITVADDLTGVNYNRLKEARDMDIVQNAWSWDGVLYAQVTGIRKPVRFRKPSELLGCFA